MALYRFICAPNMFHLFESALKYFIALSMSFWLKQFMEFTLSYEWIDIMRVVSVLFHNTGVITVILHGPLAHF